jgi:CheY-like chemotaxis protein
MPIPSELVGVSRVLVIDDDADVLRVIERVLKRTAPELTVMSADGAIDGLLKIGTFRPDAVLIDVYLPGMNGIEVCRRIRSSPETGHIVIIGMTGEPSVHLASALVEAGALTCLSKPLETQELFEVLGLDPARKQPT